MSQLRELIEVLIDCQKYNYSLADVAEQFGIEDLDKFEKQLQSLQKLIWRKKKKLIPLPTWRGIRKEEGHFEELCASQTMEHGENIFVPKLPNKGEGKVATTKKIAKLDREISKATEFLGELN